jgi:hypothetical protein
VEEDNEVAGDNVEVVPLDIADNDSVFVVVLETIVGTAALRVERSIRFTRCRFPKQTCVQTKNIYGSFVSYSLHDEKMMGLWQFVSIQANHK